MNIRFFSGILVLCMQGALICSSNNILAQDSSEGSIVDSTSNLVYSIQAAAFSNQGDAQKHKATLEADFDTVIIRDTKADGPGRYKVSIGLFDTYTGAWAERELIDAPDGAFIVNWQQEDSPISIGSADVKSTIDIQSSKQPSHDVASERLDTIFASASIKQQVMDNQTADSRLAGGAARLSSNDLFEVGRDARQNLQGVPALTTFIEKFPQDARVPAARLRLAQRLLGRGDYSDAAAELAQVQSGNASSEQKQVAQLFGAYVPLYEQKYADAAGAFKALAEDETLPASIRFNAMRQHAGVAHTMRDYPAAWKSFSTLAKESAIPEVRAEASMQLAGLAFELTLNGKGKWPEVRMLLRKIFEDATIPRETRATAELMHLETYFHEENYTEAAQLAEGFLKEYTDVPREWYVAKYLLGVSSYRTGNTTDAMTHLTYVVRQTIPRSEKFGGSEPIRNSLVWLVFIENQEGNLEEAIRWATRLWEEYPDSVQATRAESYLQISRDEVLTGGTQ